MIARVFAVALALSLVATPASAQQPDALVRVLDALTALWERGDASGLVELSAASGLELEVMGEPMGAVSGRRAAAALRHVFAARQTVTVRTTAPSRVDGAANRAFVELTWIVRPAGAPIAERNTVFIGFVQEGDQWKVSQIRILQ